MKSWLEELWHIYAIKLISTQHKGKKKAPLHARRNRRHSRIRMASESCYDANESSLTQLALLMCAQRQRL